MIPRADAPRDLLFGLLALQNGIIDQVALVAAFQAWTLAKDRSMADILIERKAIDPDDRALLNSLVARHVKKNEGDVHKSLAQLDTDPSLHASLAKLGDPEIDATLVQLKGSAVDGGADRTVTVTSGPAEAGQRFRLLRPHAKGGLGAVFVALDAELNREVALKQILEDHADDPTSRSRFLLEAEITGGLEHPGIVPVYGLGVHGDGRPYYAMRFIRGDSLRDAIDRFHADPLPQGEPGGRMLGLQKLLRRLLDVCDAIDYAHQRGVLHRDIKPDNVILGKFGETIVVDWGLAKPLGHSDPKNDSGERTLRPSASAMSDSGTVPGSVMGTPAYMSPEQASGDLDRLTATSDVYSLGATLYYLLTGKSPFQGNVVDVLQAVRKGEFPPPCKVARWISPALEAVCLKAMALKPEARYESARTLANDLERWLADEPVTAYKEPRRVKLARWERRHKLLVYGTFLSSIVATLGLGITASVVSEQKRISEQAKERADHNAGVAEANLKLAIDTAYQLLSMFSDQEFSQIPGMTATRVRLSASAVSTFDSLAGSKPDDPELQQKAARVLSNAAYAQGSVGNNSAASGYFQRAIKLLESREKRMGTSPAASQQFLLIEECCKLAAFLQDRGLYEMGSDWGFSSSRDKARKRVDELMAGSSGDSTDQFWRHRLAGRVDLIDGFTALEQGDLERASGYYQKAVERLEIAVKQPNTWFWYRLWLAHAHRGISRIAHELGQADKADREMAEALAIIRDVVAANPGKVDPKYVLAWTRKIQGQQLATDPARRPEADAAIAEAIALADDLHAKFPDEVRYTRDRADILIARAARSVADGRDADAERDLVEARKTLLELKDEGNRCRWVQLGRAETALGKIRLRQGRDKEGVELLKAALQRLELHNQERPRIVASRKAVEEARRALAETSNRPAADPGAGKVNPTR